MRVVKKKNISVDAKAPRISDTSMFPEKSPSKIKWALENNEEYDNLPVFDDEDYQEMAYK